MELSVATPRDAEAVLCFLSANRYPGVAEEDVARGILAQNESVVIRKDGVIIGWLCVHRVCGNAGVMHICVDPRWRKKWLSRGLLRELVRVIFEDMGVQILLVEGYDRDGIKLAHSLGFQMLSGAGSCMAATRVQIEGKLRM